MEDDVLAVRTTLVENFPSIIYCAKTPHEKSIRNIITFALEKGPDSIRASMLSSIIALAKSIDKSSATALLKTLASLSDWRVRYVICFSIEEVT